MIISTARQLALIIRDARTRRHMTQGQLAAAMGVTRQAVANLEAGRTVPSVAVFLAALAALDMRVHVLGDDDLGADEVTIAAGPVDLDAVLRSVRHDGGS